MTDEDVPMFDGPHPEDEARQLRRPTTEEIRVPSMTDGHKHRQPTEPLVKISAKHGGRTSLLVMQAAAAARAGRVVHLWSEDHFMLALTYDRETQSFALTEEALEPTPWRGRIQHHLDLIEA